jgi:Caspase domain/WD domain, G-beta repeat
MEGHTGAVNSVKFSPDGTLAISGSADKSVKLWKIETGRSLRTFEGHDGAVNSVAFSKRGADFISGSNDSTIKHWVVATGRLLRTLYGHVGRVNSVAFSSDNLQVMSGGFDGTIRSWHAGSGELMASTFTSRHDEWLTITPQGFLVSAHKSSETVGIVRGLEVTASDQVRQSLYNPDLVREALAGDPSGEVREAAKVINLEKVLDSGPAPVVAITSHPTGSQSADELVTLQARITDKGKGIGRIEWRVNGVTAAVSAKPPGTGPDYPLSQQLALEPGDNTVELVAYNASNLLASLAARATITFTGPADAAKPKLHVLAIGVDAYDDPGFVAADGKSTRFGKLSLAVKDATVFAAELKRAGAGQYADVKVRTALDAEATPAKLDALITEMAGDIHPRDTFILFAAAHGTSERGRFYLIPHGYRSGPDALNRTAIGQDRIQDWVANTIKAKKVLILLDTCESGALVGGHTQSRIDAPASEAAIGRLHEATGRPVLTAAATGKPALEGYKGHGVFTWALLDALKNGDSNGNGTIELSELAAHVQAKVPTLSTELKGARAAIALGGTTSTEQSTERFRQSARFGLGGEDFALVRKLQ